VYNPVHVFQDYNLAFILIFAILESWLIQHLVFFFIVFAILIKL